jgi:hypothetical protein
MFKNVASQKLTVFAYDATNGLPKTGDAANLTAYVSKNDGTVTALGDTSATEQDATNAKGYYIFDLTQAETNADKLMFSAKSTTSNIVVLAVPSVVYTVPPNFTTAVIDSAGLIDANMVKMGPTGSGVAQTARNIGASVLLSPGTGTGQVNLSSGKVPATIAAGDIANNAVTAAAIADGAIDRATFAADTGLQTLRSGTAQAGAASTITLDASASATDSFYLNDLVVITGGTGAGQVRRVTAYVGSTKVASVTPNWATNPDNTSTFAVLPAASVWDEILANHLTSGSTGAGLNAAGSAGDPWSTALPGSYGAGTAGNILGTNLDATVSSRAASASLPANFSSLVIDGAGRVNAFLIGILTSTFTEGATGRVAAAFKQFFNIASPAATMDHGVLVDTVTTLTNAPSDSSGTTTLLSRLSATRAGYLDNLSAGAVATASALTAVAGDVTTLLGRITSSLFSGITSLAQWLGLLAGKQTGNSTARTEIRATGAGSGTFDETTDSQEAIRDRGDAAWVSPAAATVADAVWDEATSGHTTAGTFGKAVSDTLTDAAAILDDTGTSGVVVAAASKTGFALTSAYDAAKTAAQAGDKMDLVDAPNATAVAAIQSGLSTLDAAGIRTSVGLASANMDSQFTAIRNKTDNLPSDPADESVLEAAIAASQTAIIAAMPSPEDNAAAVVDAATTSPLASDIKKINGTVVNGDGGITTPWGP